MIVRCPLGHENRIPDAKGPDVEYRCGRADCKRPLEIVWAASIPVSASRAERAADYVQVSRVPAIVSAAILLIAVAGKWPYAFYILLRLVVCGSAIYLAARAHRMGKTLWVWVMGGIVILFNPLVPPHLRRSDWLPIDLVAAVVFAVSVWTLRRRR
jgi:hypothetical protein